MSVSALRAGFLDPYARSLLGDGLGAEPSTSRSCVQRAPVWIDATEALDMRQLRHQTKNALQRILGVIAAASGPSGPERDEDLGRRVRLSAEISNALFGLTQAPGTMQQRLERLGLSMVGLMAMADQEIRVTVVVVGECPLPLRSTVVRIAHELIGNSIRHGFDELRRGRIQVRLCCRPDGRTSLVVSDNGKGLDGKIVPGEGLQVAQELALRVGGTVALRQRVLTEAELTVPGYPFGWSMA